MRPVPARATGDGGEAAARRRPRPRTRSPGPSSADEVQAAAARRAGDDRWMRPPGPAPRPRPRPAPPPRAPAGGPAPAPRALAGAVVPRVARGVLVLLAGVVAGLYALSRQVYFVATNDGGLVTVYRGVPYELPLGINLYEQEYASGVPARAIPRGTRRGACSTTPGAAARTRWTSCAQLERAGLTRGPGADVGALAGAVRAPARLAARGRGFAAVLATRSENVSDATITYGAVFLGLCVIAHLFIRARLPDADPYMFPLGALLAAVGLVVIYRIDTGPRPRAGPVVRGRAAVLLPARSCSCATTTCSSATATRSPRRRSRCWRMPRLPGIGAQVNGAFLAIKLGSIQFQPAEFAKLGIIIFLASYLRETGDILVRPRLRPLPAPAPGDALRDPGGAHAVGDPRVQAWAAGHDPARGVRRVAGGRDPRASLAQALRPAAPGLGPGDADADRDPRPRQLADVLRRLSRARVRGHRADCRW